MHAYLRSNVAFAYMQDWLLEGLQERVKYFRREKPSQSTTNHPKKTKKPEKKAMPIEGPMPIIDEGEDEASHGRHLKVLALECRRTKQNNLAIKELMARTYARRRESIIGKKVATDMVLKSYPPLQQYDHVS